MKIRNGFVSNSSSSSFIVAFDKVPRTVKSMVKLLFGPASEPEETISLYDTSITKGKAAEQVIQNIRDSSNKGVTRKRLIELLSGRYDTPYYENDQFYTDPSKWYGVDYDLYFAFWEYRLRLIRERKYIREKIETRVKEVLGEKLEKTSNNAWWKKVCKFKEEDTVVQELEKERHALYCNWEEESEFRRKLAEVDLDSFMEDNNGSKIKVFHYSANEGDFYSLMEHYGIFDRLPSITISNH